MRIIIVTGLAGAGKSNVLRALEDLGYYCCDNLPLPLAEQFIGDLERGGVTRAALSVDSRQEQYLSAYEPQVAALRARGHSVEVLFIEANDGVLVRRYSETHRRHPLSGDDVLAGIHRDREILSMLRDVGNVLDTTGLNVHELKKVISDRYGAGDSVAVAIQSFGFKYGIPVDCSMIFDVRFLPNPHFEGSLRHKTGQDSMVAAYVLERPEAQELIERVEDYLSFVIPLFAARGRVYATVGIGCTGGRHRSVSIVEELNLRTRDRWHPLVRHRDLHRGSQS